MPLHALIVDDDPSSLRALTALVRTEGYEAASADTLATARRLIQSRPDVIICDLILPDGLGTDLLRDVQDQSGTEVILVTANASVDTAVDALRFGAYDYLTKPVDISRLKMLLSQLRKNQALKEEISELRTELRRMGRFGPMVGTSTAMQAVYDLIERVAPTEATAFIVGESGTGKEMVAQTIHQLSHRREGPYVPLNCGAVSRTLIESELFGHERGSFTGAERQHRGIFERASRGTLFLDEITEMPIELQVKLLRVLETGQVSRVGGDKDVPVDVRVLAATNRDPEAAVRDGKLREDLYYRLNVFPIRLPPLREREGDIEVLSRHFLAELNAPQDAEKAFSAEALERLARYSWPGNVRELKNVIQRAHILAGSTITPDCLPAEITGAALPSSPFLTVRVGATLDETERRLIMATLGYFGGDKRKAAEALGVSLKTIYNRLNVYQGGQAAEADTRQA